MRNSDLALPKQEDSVRTASSIRPHLVIAVEEVHGFAIGNHQSACRQFLPTSGNSEADRRLCLLPVMFCQDDIFVKQREGGDESSRVSGEARARCPEMLNTTK